MACRPASFRSDRSHPRPHPEVPPSGFEGGFQGSRCILEASFEASAALRHLRMRAVEGRVWSAPQCRLGWAPMPFSSMRWPVAKRSRR
ncbi:hypothetical protein E4V01_03445 [Methylorubrum sp. Q1]|nr:hypothetical protein E4V01_03445 [Methylorubrum sp. Q1]